jgi:hypothetical protein
MPKLANYKSEATAGREMAEVAHILGVPEEVLRRVPEASRSGVAAVVSLLQRSLPHNLALDYLNHPNPNLSGEKPLAVILRGEAHRVEGDLLALMEGVYR